MRESLPTAAEVLAGLPAPRPDDEQLRESIRALRADDGLLLGVLDDDPTGSQAVHDVQVVTVLDEEAYGAATRRPGQAPAGADQQPQPRRARRGRGERAGPLGAGGRGRAARGAIQLVSRSDSALRGHVIAEVAALRSVHRESHGRHVDGVLLAPAFLEGRAGDRGGIRWAGPGAPLAPGGPGALGARWCRSARPIRAGRRVRLPVLDLRDFVAEKSTADAGRDVRGVGLADPAGRPDRVRELLARVRNGAWVIVEATESSTWRPSRPRAAGRAGGSSFLFRTGPSFVRALLGLGPSAPLRGGTLALGRPPRARAGRRVGSHVGQTNPRQGEPR